ncbi:MAG: tyrosine-type recombinase/integrase [Caldilineaceae bacterium]|nr:tyrosine-type recombinase/integrase [Caldilineaceae bacterium]
MSISSTIESYLEAADTGTAYTRRTYRTAMNLFRQYLAEKGIPPEVKDLEDLDVDRLLAFSTWLLEAASIGQRTLTTYLAAMMAWVSYLQVRGWLPFTPQELARLQEGIKHVRRTQRPPELIPHPPRPEEMEMLVTAARETVLRRPDDPRARLAKLRDIAIVETLRCTGLRVGELVSLTRKQLEDQDRAVWVVGKGNKVRRVYFDERSWDAIHHYLQARQSFDGATGRPLSDLPVFARHDKKSGSKVLPLSTQSIQNTIRRLAEGAGLGAKGITPHALRHFFATRIYQTTHDLAVTQTALGHASPNTTRIYAKLEDNAVRDAHREAFESK